MGGTRLAQPGIAATDRDDNSGCWFRLPRHDAAAAVLGCTDVLLRRLVMSSRLLTCLFAATALFTVGCDDSSGLDDGEAANVRVVNASPAVGEIDVLVNDEEVDEASPVPFLNGSPQCVRVDADDPELSFQQTGGTVAIPAQSFTFDDGGRNTVIVAGTSTANLRVINLSDVLTPDLEEGEARLRVVNARATQSMFIQVAPWDEPFPAPQTINTTTNQATAWIVVPAGELVSIRPAWVVGGQTIESIINFIPFPGQELIFVATDPVSDDELRWVIVEACSRP
jgi:hypothetical protein